MMQRLSAKGVRHTLVIMDPTRTCDKTLSKGPKASKSVTLDVPGVAQEEGAPQPTSLAGEERQGDGKGDVAAAKAGAGAASAEAADRAGQPLSRNRDGASLMPRSWQLPRPGFMVASWLTFPLGSLLVDGTR